MHQREDDNGVVRLRRVEKSAPPPLRIASKSPREEALRAFRIKQEVSPVSIGRRPDMAGIRRVIDAIATGEDARVAAIDRSPILSRIISFLLLPLLLAAPLAAAASEDVPLAAQVQAVVSDAVSPPVPTTTSASSDVSAAPAPSLAPSPEAPSSSSGVTPDTSTVAAGDSNSVTAPLPPPSVPSSPSSGSTQIPASNSGEDTVAIQPSSSSSSDVLGSSTISTSMPPNAVSPVVAPAASSTSSDSPSHVVKDENDSGASSPPMATSTSSSSPFVLPTHDDKIVNSNEHATSTPLEVAPPESEENMDAIRAQLRAEMHSQIENEVKSEMKDSVRDEVRMELEKSVEQKMMAKCTKVPDGSGMYCVDNIDAFGTKTEANNEVSVTSAPNPIDGNKEIFVTRGASTFQLTHNADDDINPSLDPTGTLLAWQSMQGGRFQIAWADMSEAKPRVHTLTSGENNFYPKVFGGRIAWQAWIDGNWEIVWAEPAKTTIPDDQLSPENRVLGIGGDWSVHRITHNNSPDMFPTFSRLGISWQGVDGGVWQVFSYDFETGKIVRVSRPGVSSEAPEAAMVWTEREGGEERLVGRSLSDDKSIDFTDAARHLGSHDKPVPKTPVTDTQMIATTTNLRIEGGTSSSTPSSGQ